MNDAQQPSDPRSQLEDRLNRLYHLLRRFEGLQQQKDGIYQRYRHRYATYSTKWRAGSYWLWVLILTIVLSVVAFAVFVGNVASWNTGGATSNQNVAAQMSILVVFLLPLPAALVGSGVLMGVRNARIPEVNAQRERLNQQRAAQIAVEVAPEVAPIEAQVNKVNQEFQSSFRGWFPRQYLTSEDVAACWRLVSSHRASTVEKAINEYETQLHRQRLENLAAAQIAEQQRSIKVAALGNIINAAGHGATIGAIRAEGDAAARRAAAPRNVYLRKK